MTERPLDDERLAALLDGTLNAARRAETLRALAGSEDDAAVISDAAALLRALEGEAAAGVAASGEAASEAAVVPLTLVPVAARDARASSRQRRAPWSRTNARWLAAAAVVLLCLVPLLQIQLRARGAAAPARDSHVEAVAALPVPLATTDSVVFAPASPRRLLAVVPFAWSDARSEGDALPPDMRAARLGVRLADLEGGAARRDTSAGAAALAVASLVGQIDGAGYIAGAYRRLADSLRDRAAAQRVTAADVRRAREAVEIAVGPTEDALVQFAAWAELARFAAAAGDLAFLREPASRAHLERATARFAAGTPAGDAVRRVQRQLADGTPDGVIAVRRSLDTLLAAVTR